MQVLTNRDLQTLESVARNHPQLREFLQSELTDRSLALIAMVDEAQLRRAQGYAQCLQTLINRLDEAVNPTRKRVNPQP